MLYGALVMTLWTCYGALQIVVLLLLLFRGALVGILAHPPGFCTWLTFARPGGELAVFGTPLSIMRRTVNFVATCSDICGLHDVPFSARLATVMRGEISLSTMRPFCLSVHRRRWCSGRRRTSDREVASSIPGRYAAK